MLKAFLSALLFLALGHAAIATECVDAKSTYDIAADGTDETSEIVSALVAAVDGCVSFGPGVYAFDAAQLPTYQDVPIIETAGLRDTIFKNLSPTARMFEFAPHVGGDWKTSFLNFGGITIDQNGSSGDAIKAGAMMSRLHDIWVRNVTGAGWAFNLTGITEGVLDNLLATNVSNCLRLYTAYYVSSDQFGCERTTGIGVLVESSAAVSFTSLYLDNGSVAGPSAYELLKVVSSSTVNFYNLSSEIGEAATLQPNWYYLLLNSKNVNIFGGRVNHYSNNGSHYLFYVDGSSFRTQGLEWHEHKIAMILIGGKGNIVARDTITTGVVPGSRYGIANWDGIAPRVEIDNWQDLGTPALNNWVDAVTEYIRP